MIIPDVVAERGDQMTDDEIVAACVEAGLTAGYGQVVADTVKGRVPDHELLAGID